LLPSTMDAGLILAAGGAGALGRSLGPPSMDRHSLVFSAEASASVSGGSHWALVNRSTRGFVAAVASSNG